MTFLELIDRIRDLRAQALQKEDEIASCPKEMSVEFREEEKKLILRLRAEADSLEGHLHAQLGWDEERACQVAATAQRAADPDKDLD